MDKKQNYQIISERIDDIVLLLQVMKQMELPELINSYLPNGQRKLPGSRLSLHPLCFLIILFYIPKSKLYGI
ncbi:hypothetical protein [Mastigocoleus sp. MO_188.B34]|uniref:hypothetical protein n=1 Tax=Mastigocoleus sp. MO_188.B34 TaxID=3036635 RepID=UPI0026315D07|nr:hypothetical protein [Mastigocoleus sp. MO_188.B34]MDJ0697536.1 hypothetical protein [Mastigocoleus sp. MO_188.B34]